MKPARKARGRREWTDQEWKSWQTLLAVHDRRLDDLLAKQAREAPREPRAAPEPAQEPLAAQDCPAEAPEDAPTLLNLKSRQTDFLQSLEVR